MKYGKKIYLSIFWVVLGGALIGCEAAGLLSEVWSGMGAGILGAGAVQVYRQMKYRNNEAYREKVDIAMQDERNHFIRGQAPGREACRRSVRSGWQHSGPSARHPYPPRCQCG